MARDQQWECTHCSRTTRVIYHGSDTPAREKRCSCGHPMGLVLRTDNAIALPDRDTLDAARTADTAPTSRVLYLVRPAQA